MSKIIVTAVGVSGSGKSNAYGAIIKLLQTHTRDTYYLTACGATPEERMRNTGRIEKYADIDNGFISTGTMVTTEFPFAFGGRFGDVPSYPLIDMPLIDYPGGMLQTMMDEGSPDARNLLYRIMNTDVLLLFADANILCDPEISPEQAKKRIAREINAIFNVLSTDRNAEFLSRPRTVCLILTKCDSELIPDKLRENHFRKLVNRALQVFDTTREFCINQPGWSFAVVPTSTCGDGNSRTTRLEAGVYQSEMLRSPKPYGFDLAILYGIMCELDNRLETGDAGDDELPDEPDGAPPRYVSRAQWRHILGRLSSQGSEQIKLYRLYSENLHQILDPLDGTRYFAKKL